MTDYNVRPKTDYTHEQWNKAVKNGDGYVRMGGNPNVKFVNASKLTPEQIERANNIERNGYFIPPKNIPDNRINTNATRGYNGLQKFFGKILGDQKWMDKYYPTGGAAPLSEDIYQEQLSFNPSLEDIRAKIFQETPDQQKQRLNQNVIDYMRFKMQNPNFLFNDYIDDEIRDINHYKKDRLIT